MKDVSAGTVDSLKDIKRRTIKKRYDSKIIDKPPIQNTIIPQAGNTDFGKNFYYKN